MNLLEQLFLGLRLTRDATAATYALLLYEFLIIFDREHETIYKSRWTLTKCLYLASRFGLLLGWPVVMYAFLFDHDMESCKPFLVVVTILFMLFPCFAQFIFILRAYAITGAKRSSLLIYIPALFGYLFVSCWYSLNEMVLWKDVFLLLGRTGCWRVFPHGYSTFSRVLFAGIALDGVIGLMLVIHFLQLPGPRTRLRNLLITQGIIYFPLMFLLNTGAAIVSSVGTFRGYDALVFFAVITISNIMACRFVLQIREYLSNKPNSLEMISRVSREVERSFPAGPFSTKRAPDSLAWPNGKNLSKA